MGAVPCLTKGSVWVHFNDTKQQKIMNDFYCSYTFTPETRSNIISYYPNTGKSEVSAEVSLLQS